MQQGRAQDAVNRFDAALRIAPNLYEAQLNRAIALQIAGDNRAAAAQLENLLQKLPKAHVYDAQRSAARTLLSRLHGV